MANRGRPKHPDVLAPREWEVLALIREGLTNAEIADRLGLSADTAKTHVSSILSKLGVATREEAAAWQQAHEGAQPHRWGLAFWAKVGLGAAALAVLAALGLLSWGVTRSDEGAHGTSGAMMVYLAPENELLWLGTNEQLANSGVRIVHSSTDLAPAVDASVKAIVIDRDSAADVDAAWVEAMRAEGKVIVGARMNAFDLTPGDPPPELEPSGPASARSEGFDFYRPPQVYYTLYRLGESCSGGAQGLAGVSDPDGFTQFVAAVERHASRIC